MAQNCKLPLASTLLATFRPEWSNLKRCQEERKIQNLLDCWSSRDNQRARLLRLQQSYGERFGILRFGAHTFQKWPLHISSPLFFWSLWTFLWNMPIWIWKWLGTLHQIKLMYHKNPNVLIRTILQRWLKIEGNFSFRNSKANFYTFLVQYDIHIIVPSWHASVGATVSLLHKDISFGTVTDSWAPPTSTTPFFIPNWQTRS